MGSSSSKSVKTKQQVINETITNINNNISSSLTNTITKKTQNSCESSAVQSITAKKVIVDGNSGTFNLGNKAKVNVSCYLKSVSVVDLRKDLSNSIMDALTKTLDSNLLNKINAESKSEVGSLSLDNQNITSDTYSKNSNVSTISNIVSNEVSNNVDEQVIQKARSDITQLIDSDLLVFKNNSGTVNITNDIDVILKSEAIVDSTNAIIDNIVNSTAFQEDVKLKATSTSDVVAKSESTGIASVVTSIGSAISSIISSATGIYIILVVICCCFIMAAGYYLLKNPEEAAALKDNIKKGMRGMKKKK
jgi:hypothetical protein